MKSLWWNADHLVLLDQTRLPSEQVELHCSRYQQVAEAIRTLQVRGAPAIGVTAAYGLALAARNSAEAAVPGLLADVRLAADELRATRPTAVNLAWALDRCLRVASGETTVAALRARLLEEADRIAAEDEAMCRAIGRHGADLVPDGARILTHCNAGALATAAYGTSLGVIRAAHEQGKRLHVFVDETRPLLQGARLTAWELQQDGIPLTLITDSMAGHFMQRGQIDLAIVGADRIAANGDVANKIGTYSVAVLARAHGIPFYVAAPTSTIDLSLATGEEIPIEERRPEEVTHLAGRRLAPEGVGVANPAFDVTPNGHVSAIVAESGVIRAPYSLGLRAAVEAAGRAHLPTAGTSSVGTSNAGTSR